MSRAWSRPGRRWPAVHLAVYLVGVLAGGACRSRPAAETYRWLEARLAEATMHSPCAEIRPATGALAPSDCATGLGELERQRLLGEESGSPRDPARALHHAARLLAVDRGPSGLERALRYLGRLLPAEGDFSAALARGALEHARAGATGDPWHLLQALEETESSLSLRPASPAARFNRALVQSELGLCFLAERSWGEFLAVETNPAWAAEGRRRLDMLPCRDSAPPRDGPDAWSRRALEELLPAWASEGDPKRREQLRLDLAALGERLAEKGDPLVRELAEELERWGGEVGYRRAVVRLAEGKAEFDRGAFSAAAELLEGAVTDLVRRRSALAAWSRIWQAGSRIQVGRFVAAEKMLSLLGEHAAIASPLLRGRREWTRGFSLLRQGRLSAALDRFEAAERAFAEGAYSSSLAATQTLQAETLARLGFLSEAWAPRCGALRVLQAVEPGPPFRNGLLEGAWSAQQANQGAVAVAMLDEAELVAARQESPRAQAEALLFRGLVLSRLPGAAARAESAFRQVLGWKGAVLPPEPQARFVAMATLGLAELGALRAGDLEPLDIARSFFQERGPRWREALTLHRKAQLLAAGGDLGAAHVALREAVDSFRTEGESSTNDPARIRYLESIQGIFDEAAIFELQRGDAWAALMMLEGSRGNLPVLGNTSRLRSSLAEIPGGRVIVQLSFLAGDLVWFRLSAEGFTSGTRPGAVVTAALGPLVSERHPPRPSDEQLAEAYQALLAPALVGIEPGRSLVLIPEGVLQRVPFAALFNSRSGARLIEERALTFATSLAMALEQGRPAGDARRSRAWRAVLVGDPSFDSGSLNLDPLPAARREVESLAKVYGQGAAVLTQEKATLRAVRGAVPEADVLHVGAHVLAGGEGSEDTLLLAADGETGASGLTATRDLLSVSHRLKVVFLAGCRSLGREGSRSSGPLGVARAFVQAEVPVTVATLWDLDDEAFVPVARDFHEGLRSGLAASEALRQAQIRALERAEPAGDLSWAGFELVGDLPAQEGGGA